MKKLIGKEVDVFGKTGKVVGCDYDIGITIVAPNNDYLLCINGPLSPWMKEKPPIGYDLIFSYFVGKIQEGKLVTDEFEAFVCDNQLESEFSGGASSESCAFGQ